MTQYHRYHRPDMSDKNEDESPTQYWDRKRRELHGPDCKCILCLNEMALGPDSPAYKMMLKAVESDL